MYVTLHKDHSILSKKKCTVLYCSVQYGYEQTTFSWAGVCSKMLIVRASGYICLSLFLYPTRNSVAKCKYCFYFLKKLTWMKTVTIKLAGASKKKIYLKCACSCNNNTTLSSVNTKRIHKFSTGHKSPFLGQ